MEGFKDCRLLSSAGLSDEALCLSFPEMPEVTCLYLEQIDLKQHNKA